MTKNTVDQEPITSFTLTKYFNKKKKKNKEIRENSNELKERRGKNDQIIRRWKETRWGSKYTMKLDPLSSKRDNQALLRKKRFI